MGDAGEQQHQVAVTSEQNAREIQRPAAVEAGDRERESQGTERECDEHDRRLQPLGRGRTPQRPAQGGQHQQPPGDDEPVRAERARDDPRVAADEKGDPADHGRRGRRCGLYPAHVRREQEAEHVEREHAPDHYQRVHASGSGVPAKRQRCAESQCLEPHEPERHRDQRVARAAQEEAAVRLEQQGGDGAGCGFGTP